MASKFNPDDFLGGEFNPDEFLNQVTEAEPAPVPQELATPPSREGLEAEFSSNPELEARLQGRKFEVEQSRKAMESGEIGFIEGETQILGKGGAGAALDFLGSEIGEAGKGLFMALPTSVQDDIKLQAAAVWDKLSNSSFGGLVSDSVAAGSEALDKLEEADPQSFKTLESVVNLGMMFAPAKAKANAPPVKVSKPIAKLAAKTRRFEKASRSKHADDFVRPFSTKAVRTEEAKRTITGTFVDKPQLAAHEARMSKEILRHPEINAGNSVQKNLNLTIKANNKLGDQLRKDVIKTGQPISENITANLNTRLTKLIDEDPIFAEGAAGLASKRRLVQANKIIAKHPKTAEGMLNARQEFDALVFSQKGQKGFTDMGNAVNVATKEIRSEMNDVIHRNVGVNAKNSLRRQSLLFDTIDNVAVKAGELHNHAIGRVVQNVGRVLQAKQMLIATGLLFGAGAVTSMSGALPYLAGTMAVGGIGMVGRKIVMSPSTRKGIVELLKLTDKAIKQSANAAMRVELKADRAALFSILKEVETSKDDNQ